MPPNLKILSIASAMILIYKTVLTRLNGNLGHGQEDFEGCAFVYPAVHFNISPVPLNDSKRDGQAQTGALALRFSCEERVEDIRQDVLGNTIAGIIELNFEIIALRGDRCRDSQHSSAGHGIKRIQDKI